MKILVVDGNSILNRAFYAIPYLTAPDGLHTGGIYGFLVSFMKTVKAEAPDGVAVAFDLPAPTFRHQAFSEYKATRHKMPAELAEQLPVLKEILAAMQVTILEQEGYEADDIIGTVSRLCEEAGADCRIMTGDRDDLQLASEKTHILLTTTRGGKTETVEYDSAAVAEKYGVSPLALIEVKGLMGDTSDNIPGVRGIGEKTALSLIQKYQTLEGVYENIDEIRGAQHTKLTDGREMAFLSRDLGRICREVPITQTLSDFAVRPYQEDALGAIFRRLEFRALLEELSIPAGKAETVSAEAVPYANELENEKMLYFYAEDDTYLAGLVGKIASEYSNYQFNYLLEKDAPWNFYFNVVYPSAVEFQIMKNRKVVQNMARAGADLSEQYEVNHWFFFDNGASRGQAKVRLMALGYEILEDNFYNENVPGTPFGLHILGTHDLQIETLTELTYDFFDLAEEYQGIYDGWEVLPDGDPETDFI